MTIMDRGPLGASTVKEAFSTEKTEEAREIKRPMINSPGRAIAKDRKSSERGCPGRRAFPPRKTNRYPMSNNAGTVYPRIRTSSWEMTNRMVSCPSAAIVSSKKPPEAKPGKKRTA
jgi:hypothetical protein